MKTSYCTTLSPRADAPPVHSASRVAGLAVICLSCALIFTLAGCASGNGSSQSTANTATPTPTGPPLFAFQPHVGDSASQFPAAFGQPYQRLPEEDVYYGDSTHDVAVGVHVVNGKAVHLYISGDFSWSDQRTFDECALFLPPGATVIATPPVSTAPTTTYSSNIGEIMLTNHGLGACEVYLAGD